MMASLGYIPDFSTAKLYATVVMNTRDDPRLLALWCHIAIWRPIDHALGENISKEVWEERTGFTSTEINALLLTLIERDLLDATARINWFVLEQISREAVLPYSNEMRRREGIRPLVATQPSLLPE